MSEFIEFEVGDPARFQTLQRVFYEIKKDKDAGAFRAEEEWVTLFDPAALHHFLMPTTEDRADWIEDQKSVPLWIIPTEEATGQTWDFFAMIDAFTNGEYNLLSCEMVVPRIARLEFYSLAYPYGGVGCMVALIEAFGFRVTGIQDGTGYITMPYRD